MIASKLSTQTLLYRYILTMSTCCFLTTTGIYKYLRIRRLSMAKTQINPNRRKLVKRTSQGGSKPKTSSMNKHQRRSYKQSRGQG